MTNRERRKSSLNAINKYGKNTADIVGALSELKSLYTTDMLSWMGSLFDTRLGGFYYSLSAKQSEGYLPDIESTYQVLAILKELGVISKFEDIPELLRQKIAAFTCSLEDEKNGYFYHPQWSKELTNMYVSRKERDLNSAIALSRWLGFNLPYPSATNRITSMTAISKDMSEVSKFEEELKSFYLEFDNCEVRSEALYSLFIRSKWISALGYDDDIIRFFEEKQNAQTGIWVEPTGLDSVYTSYVISNFYNSLGRKIPNAYNAAKTLTGICFSGFSENVDLNSICCVHHIWGALGNILKNIRANESGNCGEEEKEIVSVILDMAPQLIRETKEYLERFKKSTGGFSYFSDHSSITSQGLPATPIDTVTGDVNATCVAVAAIVDVYEVLGVKGQEMKIFTTLDFNKFLSTIDLTN